MKRISVLIASLLCAEIACAQSYPAHALSGEIQKAMRAQDLRQRYFALGLDRVANTPDEMMAFLRTEQPRYGEIVRKANTKLE
jgi:tripartite-type tricarboxylate transporter receptor subunit TctC